MCNSLGVYFFPYVLQKFSCKTNLHLLSTGNSVLLLPSLFTTVFSSSFDRSKPLRLIGIIHILRSKGLKYRIKIYIDKNVQNILNSGHSNNVRHLWAFKSWHQEVKFFMELTVLGLKKNMTFRKYYISFSIYENTFK